MTDKKLFTEHSKNYILCYNNQCEKHERCLRWILKDYVPKNQQIITAINPRYKNSDEGDMRKISKQRET